MHVSIYKRVSVTINYYEQQELYGQNKLKIYYMALISTSKAQCPTYSISSSSDLANIVLLQKSSYMFP